MRAGRYNVLQDFGDVSPDDITASPYWIIAIMRQGQPLSFSRTTMSSVDKNIINGALLRNDAPLVITDDCLHLATRAGKSSHTKFLTAVLKQTSVNYLVEILPGDWAMAWIVNNETDFIRVLASVEAGKASNGFKDGLKFLGRVHGIRKQVSVDRGAGVKTSVFHLEAVGFQELNTQLFYDRVLSAGLNESIGQWLARLGIEMDELYKKQVNSITKDNINQLVPILIDLIVGKGPRLLTRQQSAFSVSPTGEPNKIVADLPSSDNQAPYSYLVPLKVGQLLGVADEDKVDVLGYAGILEQVMGVQDYPVKSGIQIFTPGIEETVGRRRFTPTPMLGTFAPMTPETCNRPLWDVIRGYSNPVINEMYTAMRVNPDGKIMPTFVMRQIPFTTDAFSPALPTRTTRYLDMPRWVVPDVMVSSVDIGRSDQTHFNFIHIYGNSSESGEHPVQFQLVQNPPIRDDIDIMRSGLRPYMTTVQCFVADQLGKVPGTWMALVADFLIGSQYSFNGTIHCYGIQSPICEGDNLEFDGVVYHIESVSHTAGMDMNGHKTWSTTLSLTNGMRADLRGDVDGKAARFPLYPGFERIDNTALDPGLSEEQRASTGGTTTRQGDPEEIVERNRLRAEQELAEKHQRFLDGEYDD